ncbi:MAG TPA: hypothetical protein VH814_21210 [Steroidobacteraceae bacterium]|jgi:hypothetical protein
MARRIALASAYTLFVAALLLTWPLWRAPVQVDNVTVITAVPIARWLLIVMPLYWGWVAFHLETRSARRMGLAAAALLLLACFLLVWYHDNVLGYAPCLWDSGNCGPGWFN